MYAPRLLSILMLLSAGALFAQPSRVVRVPRSTHPLTMRARDLGRAPADLPVERILLQLKSSPAQQAELEELIAAQHDPASPRYRQWLSPEEFGERFGPTQTDLDALTGWLQAEGFRVDAVARGRRSVEFSGSVEAVERTFLTQMHRYEWDGEQHIANAGDLSIPAALEGMVGGVVSLHDFRSRAQHKVALTNLGGGGHGLSPSDFAAVYNVSPLWNQNFDGTGQSVAVAGRTNIRPGDAPSFRSLFGLPANPPVVILNGADPGILNANEEMEADLDVQWSGAVAKGAEVKFVVSKSTLASDGIDLSIQYIVNNNVAPVVTVSFGACEADLGPANAFYNSLWQQAAAQGMSVFVSAGDSGSAGCDAPSSTSPASRGFGVNGLASTAYNVAVGGTQFADSTNPAAYWNASNDARMASARGYIPEAAWNESAAFNSLYAGSGGVSQMWSKPAWQAGNGVPASDPGSATGHHRYLPDVSLAAAGHTGYLVVRNGNLYGIAGTSASSPALAGIMAIVNQYTGARNGNPNPRLYGLAAQSSAVFHDVTAGTIAVPCKGGTANCSAAAGSVGVLNGFSAGAGYDLATGLGSLDAYAMAVNWGAVAAAPPSVTSLTPSPMPTSDTPQILTINGSGFAPGATVTASYSGGSVSLPVSSIAATRVIAAITVGKTVRDWTIRVTNPGGVSTTATLAVAAPAPAISGLNPASMTGSAAAQTLSIAGSGFLAGNGLKVVLGYPGFSQTYSGSQVSMSSSGALLVNVNVGTAARTWTVQVVNPNGAASNVVNLPVAAPPAAPVITSLNPNPMGRSTALQILTINGRGFAISGSRVLLMYPGYAVYLPVSSVVSATSTQLRVAMSPGSVPRTWTIQVVNPGNVPSNTMDLTVK